MLQRKTKPETHQIPPEVKSILYQCSKLDNYHGILAVLEDWTVISITIFLSLHAFQYLPWILPITGYLLAVIVIGCRMRALATLLHESSHCNLAANEWLNKFLGTVVSGYLILQSYSVYVESHIKRHHGNFGVRDKDPDYVELIKAGIYGKTRSSTSLYNYLISALNPVPYLQYIITHRIWSPKENPKEKTFRICFYFLLIIIIKHLNLGFVVFWYWIIPFITTASWVGTLIELSEHYPLLEVSPNKIDLYLSRNRVCDWFTNWLLGIHEEGWHLVHHMFPRVPFWRQRELHEAMMRFDKRYRELHKIKGWFGILAEMFEMAERKVDNEVRVMEMET